MEKNYTIEEILLAASDLNKKNKLKKKKNFVQENKNVRANMGLPHNTLQIIEEAEKNKT